MIGKEVQEALRQRLRRDHTNGVGPAKQIDDVTEVLGMRSNQDGFSELRRLDDVVSAAGHQAAADEGDIGDFIKSGKLADAVEQENSGRNRIRSDRARAALIRYARRCDHLGDLVEAFGMAWRYDKQCGRVLRLQLPKHLEQ